MNFYQQLQDATAADRQWLLEAPIIKSALDGQVSRDHYIAFLTQAYHHVRHTVPLLMACGSRLPLRLEWLRKAVAEYIEEEYGHEQWILNDIEACGGDAAAVRDGTPGLSTDLMVSYVYDVINRRNPIGFFGMVHVLEGTSVVVATNAADKLQESLGLPNKAFTYLKSHGSLDIEHIAFFENLMNQVESKDDKDAILRTAHVVYQTYGQMFRDITEYNPAAELREAS